MYSVIKFIKDYQPVSYTGAVAHCYYWLTSSTGSYYYKNPLFEASEGEEPIAIYCVHGTADQPKSFSRVAERLLEKGLSKQVKSIHLVGFTDRYQGKPIEHFSQQLIDEIIANGHRRVIFLGHSRGGLVNAFADFMAKNHDITVEMVVGIASPFYGSYLAGGLCSMMSTSVQQMEIDSLFLKDLAEKIMDSSAKYYFFVGGQDGIVSPEASYLTPYTDKYPDALTIFNRHGHLSLMSSWKMVDKIKLLIDSLPCEMSTKLEINTDDAEPPIPSFF